jgi:glucan phosphoethanolaminetransferase (alkaline phosphatase superfamily)
MRYAAFFLGVLSGVLELAGGIMGLGIAGVGFYFFSWGGPLPLSMGVGFVIIVAIATIFLATAVMFVRDARPIALILVVASVGAALAGGPFTIPGAVAGMTAAAFAYRLDRAQALI